MRVVRTRDAATCVAALAARRAGGIGNRELFRVALLARATSAAVDGRWWRGLNFAAATTSSSGARGTVGGVGV